MPLASFSSLVGPNLIVFAIIAIFIGVTIAIALALNLFLVRSSNHSTKSVDTFVKYASRRRYIQFAVVFCVYIVLFWLINLVFDHFHILGPRWTIPKTLFMALGFTLVFFFAPRRSIWRR